MKLYKVKIFLTLGAVLLLAGSCKKEFFTDVNKNPNGVIFVQPNLLLPTCEIALAFTQGGDFSRYSSLLTQQAFGNQNQTQTFYQYGLNPGSFDNGWTDIYTSTMENIYALKTSSDSLQYNAYGGVAKIMLAYCLQMVVDYWGDVPYTDALKGNVTGGAIQPKYDKAPALYDTAMKLIDAAIAQFHGGNLGLIKPQGDDVIYGGDLAKWEKFGHAIKARLYLHQSKGNPAMAANALTELASSFQQISDGAQYKFDGGGTTSAPWAQFMSDRADYITFNDSSYLIHKMTTSNDPRYGIYTDSSGGLGTYYGDAASPVEFITYDETQFMTAEAVLRNGGSYVAAQAFYQQALDSNMAKLGVAPADIVTYKAANGILPVTSTDDAIAQVAAQEYIALFLNPEAFTLYRRTGVPAISPKGPGGVPRRLIYPQNEYSYNPNNVPASTLQQPKLFWDN